MHRQQADAGGRHRTGGGWRLPPGAVYPTIAQLEDEGLVQVSAEGGRKLVTLPRAGRRTLKASGTSIRSRPSAGTARPRRPARRHRRVMGAAAQLARVADAAQLAAAAKVLSDARRALYLILAGEAGDGAAGVRPRGVPAT